MIGVVHFQATMVDFFFLDWTLRVNELNQQLYDRNLDFGQMPKTNESQCRRTSTNHIAEVKDHISDTQNGNAPSSPRDAEHLVGVSSIGAESSSDYVEKCQSDSCKVAICQIEWVQVPRPSTVTFGLVRNSAKRELVCDRDLPLDPAILHPPP